MNHFTGTTGLIGIAPIGKIPDIVTQVVSANLFALFQTPTQILSPLQYPKNAYDSMRGQYDAGVIIDSMEQMTFEVYEKLIAVTNIDLFVPIFTHVFGEARQNGKVALVSLFRLRENHFNELNPSPLILKRVTKVALHETGHLFNLFHCEDPRCLMHFSGLLEELDQAPLYFCRYCAAYLKDALSRH